MSKNLKVLICIDGSELSELAFEFYANNLHREGNEVTCFHCIHPPYFPGESAHTNPHVYQVAVKDSVSKAEELEVKYAKRMKEHKMPGTVTARISNEPGHEIVKKSKEDHSNMIVLATKGHGALRSTILGSVSHHVLHHAHCPLVIYSQKHP